MQSRPDILIHADGLVGSPDEPTAEEGPKQDDAVVPLVFGARQVQFIEEPVDVEERGGEFVEDECGTVEIEEGSLKPTTIAQISICPGCKQIGDGERGVTYKTKTEHAQGTHAMRPHPPAEDAHIPARDHQIPQEVPSSQALNHATPARVAVHALHGAHVHALLVHVHDPQRGGIDGARLHERDDVHVPVDLRAPVELRVDGWEEVAGYQGGDDGLDELVEEE